MAFEDARWRTGFITSQNGGSVATTGLGGTPLAMFFWGTNWTAEDTLVTSTGTGMFRGMAGDDYTNPGTIIQDSVSVTPAGDASAQQPHAITMMDTSGAIAFSYAADVASFDVDGFTITWLGGSVPGHKVVYAALMSAAGTLNHGAYKGSAGVVAALGWKAGASLVHGNWQWAPTGFAAGDRTQMWLGGGAYPGTAGGATWMGAGLSALTFPTSASAQYDIGIYDQAPGVLIAHAGIFIGPFLVTSNVVAQPTGALTDFTFGPTTNNGGMFVAWDDEASATGRLTPETSPPDTVTVSGLPFSPGLVTGYSISNEPQGQGTGGRGAIGFSVLAENFQWAATVDGVSRGAYQSFSETVVDSVDAADVHAASGQLTNDGFILTTDVNTGISPESWVWHAFGSPDRRQIWVPHIYRRVLG